MIKNNKLTYNEMKKRFDGNKIHQIIDKLDNMPDDTLTKDLDTLIEMTSKQNQSTIMFLFLNEEKSNFEDEDYYLDLESWEMSREDGELTFKRIN